MIEFAFWRRVKYIRRALAVETRGLECKGQSELRIEVDSVSLVDGAEAFLRFVVKYLHNSGRTIRPNETLRYGYWLVKFVSAKNILEVWEYNENATEFVRGGSLAVRYWLEQHRICRRYNAGFSPPEPDSLTAVSVGVFEGLPVQGMRYPWPARMSGWLIVTDSYAGDVKSLTNHHTYHLTAARPELASYLALPYGFGFDLRQGERVWYDKRSLREHMVEYFGEDAARDE